MDDINFNKCSKAFEIREHYCEMLQNSVLFSPVYGRAETYEGLPYYCNGENLLVVGYSVNNSQAKLNQRVNHVVLMARDRWGEALKSIQFWGPVRPHDIKIPDDFVCTNECKPDHANRDVILMLDNVSYKRVKNGRDIRRAIRNGLSVGINSSKTTTQEHSNIFNAFFKTHTNIDKEDYIYFTSWKEVLADESSILFDVKQGGRLTGFAILSCFGKHTATYAYGFFNNSVAGTSDLAHGAMIDYCHLKGFDMLDLGYSINATLLRYKKKWGITHLVDPPWSVYWKWRGAITEKQVVN
jgi:hypothetical protein